MTESNRYYRKKLTSFGFIYLADEEVEIAVRNLSLTGLLAEISDNYASNTLENRFNRLKESLKIDLWLPEMRLIGEADIVRADMDAGKIYLALEFSHITHDIDNVLYKRKNYRKELQAPGMIVFEGRKHTFTTRNVSVTGLLAHFAEQLPITEGAVTIFDFQQLQLRGKIKVIWVELAEDGGTLVGLEYVEIKKDQVHGIPRFEH
jgi:hypothetical protein